MALLHRFDCTLYIKDHAGLSHHCLGVGLGPMELGKISGVLTKIGKFDIVLMYDISIARLIPTIKLVLVYYEKRERKKQV